jgi:hypothetical protein
MSIVAGAINNLYFKYCDNVMRTANGEPFQNSMLWMPAQRHCQVAEFLQHIIFQSIQNLKFNIKKH